MSDSIDLECVEDGASKFWSGTVKGNVLTTRWGKIGTKGQSKEETFADPASALASLEKQSAGKLKKGYQAANVSGGNLSASGTNEAMQKNARGAPGGAAAKSKASTKSSVIGLKVSASPISISDPNFMKWLVDGGRTAQELELLVGSSLEIDQVIAAHSATSSEILGRLSRSSDRETLARVAGNPSTPSADYVRLAAEFPGEFLANPLFDILLLENPCFWHQVPLGRFFVNARWSECPDSFWLWSTLHADWEEILSGESDEELAENYEDLAGELYWRDCARDELVGMIAGELKNSSFLGIPRINLMSLLAKNENSDIRRLVARMEFTPQETLEMLASDRDASVREAVASNDCGLQHVVEALAEDREISVRCAAAINPLTPDRISVPLLESLATNRSLWIREKIGGSARVPLPILELLAKDSDWRVRDAVAGNPRTPAAVLANLSRDKHESVRGSAFGNSSITVNILEQLFSENSIDGNDLHGLYNLDEDVLIGLARNHKTPEFALKFLSNYGEGPDTSVRVAVAENSGASPAVLEGFMNASHKDVRLSLARNPAVTVHILQILTKDSDSDVAGNARLALAKRQASI